MRRIFMQTFVARLFALAVLTGCLAIVARHSGNSLLASTKGLRPTPSQVQSPIVSVEIQPDTPLRISTPRVLLADSQNVEFAFDLTNVSSKPIRAYAIKQDLIIAGDRSSRVLFTSMELSGTPALDVNSLKTDVDTCEAGNDERVSLSVDYVEFSDGTKWGGDSGNSADTSAGQRAAAWAVTKLLIDSLDTGGRGAALKLLGAGLTYVEPPAAQSEQWKQGFRFGRNSLISRLNRAKDRGGVSALELELRQIAAKLNGAP